MRTLLPAKQVVANKLLKTRVDFNMEKWPIWQPAQSRNNKRDLRFEGEAIMNGEKTAVKLSISGSMYGALTTEDQSVFYGIMQLWEEAGSPTDRPVPFSKKRLLEICGKTWSGTTVQDLEMSLLRIRLTGFDWFNSYYDKELDGYIDTIETFNILTELKLKRTRSKTSDKTSEEEQEVSYFKINERIISNIHKKYSKPVLVNVFRELPTDIGKILYTFLDQKLCYQNSFTINTKKLFESLNLTGDKYKYSSKRKAKLMEIMVSIKNIPLSTGRLIVFDITENAKGDDYKCVFRKGAMAGGDFKIGEKGEENVRIVSKSKSADKRESNEEELVKYFYKSFKGIDKHDISEKAKGQATSLIANYGLEKAKKIVDYVAQKKGDKKSEIDYFGFILNFAEEAFSTLKVESDQNSEILKREQCIKCQGKGAYPTIKKSALGTDIEVMVLCNHQ